MNANAFVVCGLYVYWVVVQMSLSCMNFERISKTLRRPREI